MEITLLSPSPFLRIFLYKDFEILNEVVCWTYLCFWKFIPHAQYYLLKNLCMQSFLVFNSPFLNYTLFLLVWIKFILFTFRRLKPVGFFVLFHCLVLCKVFFCLADQVPLSSPKLKRKVNSISLNLAFWKFKGMWKKGVPSLPLWWGSLAQCWQSLLARRAGLCPAKASSHLSVSMQAGLPRDSSPSITL